VSKGVHDVKYDFSASNFAKMTCLWLAALKRREDNIFPAVYDLAQAASHYDVKQGDIFTGLDSTTNACADIESDESENAEAADADADANANANADKADLSMEEVDDMVENTKDSGSRLCNGTRIMQRK
jgi:hypothetical protein